MPLVPTTKMADARKYSVSGNHWPGEPHDLLKTTSPFEFRPAFFFFGGGGEPIPRHVFSINTSSSNTQSLFPIFYCSANTHSPVWHSYSLTDVKSHKMDKPRKPSFPQNTLPIRLFPTSETPTVSNHRKKWTFKNMLSTWIGHFYYLTLSVVLAVLHTHTHTHTGLFYEQYRTIAIF